MIYRSILSIRVIVLTFALAVITPGWFLKASSDPSANNQRGHKLYLQYCASCHGVDGKGQGPVAASLKTPPPDLTIISKKDGKFPGTRMRLVIAGQVGDTELSVHGTREMPVWGRYFRFKEGDKSVATLDVYALLKYIESIQQS